jgi:hypothetical protein
MREALLLALLPIALRAQTEMTWPVHSLDRPRPPVVAPGDAVILPPPSDAIVLFDGRDLSDWEREEGGPAGWITRDGYLEIRPGSGSIRTKREFGSVQLHVEWMVPSPAHGEGQDRGNSGVFLMSRYEVQVLDSYHNDTYSDGQAAALYGQMPPLVNACRPPGQWQSYDMVFHRPAFNPDGTMLRPARITVLHNGVLVHDNVPFAGRTVHGHAAVYEAHPDRLPLLLQDHGHPVRFRNIWIRGLPDNQP